MEMSLRQVADLPGPGEYDDYDRDHRQIHLNRLAGKFSQTVRMGRDLAQAEAAKVRVARHVVVCWCESLLKKWKRRLIPHYTT